MKRINPRWKYAKGWMICLIVFKMIPPGKHEACFTMQGPNRIIKTTFNTPIQPMIGNATSSIGSIGIRFCSVIPSDYPNQMFASSIDLKNIKKDIMARDLHRLIAEELEDQEAFMALSNEIISDLLDDEPDIYTIDDVKVRFR